MFYPLRNQKDNDGWLSDERIPLYVALVTILLPVVLAGCALVASYG